MIVAGHLSLALPKNGMAYLGIALVALGTGLLKPNVSAMVGTLYEQGDARRDSDTAYFGGLAVVTIVFALILFTLSPWIRRHTDLRQTS